MKDVLNLGGMQTFKKHKALDPKQKKQRAKTQKEWLESWRLRSRKPIDWE